MEGKTLILYYSYTNNTKKIAEKIKGKIGCDIARIDTIVPYSNDYDTVVNQGQDEINSNYHPEIKKLAHNPENYDTIILGTPVWWYTFAPAVSTALSQYNFDSKKIIPFVTNGGWIGHTVNDIQKACPNSKVENAISIEFSGSNLSITEEKLDKWIESLI